MDISNIKSYLAPKEFQILLNGILQIVKIQVDERNLLTSGTQTNQEDYEILIEKLKTLNNELENNDLSTIIQGFELIVKKSALENWSNEQLSAYLSNNSFPEDYTQIFLALWTKESARIHQKLIESSTFNSKLNNNIMWRVDMNAMSKQSSDINEAIAHFELQLKSDNISSSAKKEEVVKFEMNREEINSILNQFQQIQACYSQLLAKPTN